MPTPQLLPTADDLFRAKGLLQAASDYLKREKFPARSLESFQYEAEAISLWWYEVALFPGLLQTEEYARALIGNHSPALDDAIIEERVRARLERQQLLDRKPPASLSFVMYEAALRCPIGGNDVHRRQLLHLLKVSQLRHVSLQVLPFERAVPAALAGPMVLLEMPDHERFVLAEGQSVTQFTSDLNDVSTLTQRHGMIRMQALSAEETRRFIERMVDE